MEIAPVVSFRGIEPDGRLRERLDREIAALERFCDEIIGCRVMVEVPHRSQQSGNLHHVRIDVTVPDEELVVSRDPPGHRAHEELTTTVVDAFAAMRRQLEDYARRRRREVKRHEEQPRGRITKIFAPLDYGFLETPDGTEVYFHRNSVIDGDFDDLEVGDEVRFAREQGIEGPQASSVHAS